MNRTLKKPIVETLKLLKARGHKIEINSHLDNSGDWIVVLNGECHWHAPELEDAIYNCIESYKNSFGVNLMLPTGEEMENFTDIPERYWEDVQSMVDACGRKELVVTPNEVYQVWNNYSDMYAAGWLGIPSDDNDIVKIIENYEF